MIVSHDNNVENYGSNGLLDKLPSSAEGCPSADACPRSRALAARRFQTPSRLRGWPLRFFFLIISWLFSTSSFAYHVLDFFFDFFLHLHDFWELHSLCIWINLWKLCSFVDFTGVNPNIIRTSSTTSGTLSTFFFAPSTGPPFVRRPSLPPVVVGVPLRPPGVEGINLRHPAIEGAPLRPPCVEGIPLRRMAIEGFWLLRPWCGVRRINSRRHAAALGWGICFLWLTFCFRNRRRRSRLWSWMKPWCWSAILTKSVIF